jgi:murein DD-endopeptidase MepM/ murein hydrolase activator NlpD
MTDLPSFTRDLEQFRQESDISGVGQRPINAATPILDPSVKETPEIEQQEISAPSFADDIASFNKETIDVGSQAKEVASRVNTLNVELINKQEEAAKKEQEKEPYDPTGKTPEQIMAETGQQSLLDDLGKKGIDVNQLAQSRQMERKGIDAVQLERVNQLVSQGLSEKEAFYNVAIEGNVEEDIPGLKLFEGDFDISQQFNNFNPSLYKGITADSRHKGLDVAVPKNTELKAPVSGEVRLGFDQNGYGRNVVIIDELGNSHRISHMDSFSPQAVTAANEGKKIGAGQSIGLSGGKGRFAGNSTGYHTDISVRNSRGQFVNPLSLSVYSQLF